MKIQLGCLICQLCFLNMNKKYLQHLLNILRGVAVTLNVTVGSYVITFMAFHFVYYSVDILKNYRNVTFFCYWIRL